MRSQGYPLEMKVTRLFRAHGFNAIQATYYEDVETGKHRETDIIASVDSQVNHVLVRIEFVIECKSSLDKPWILFTGGRRLSNIARITQRVVSIIGMKTLDQLCRVPEIQKLALFDLPGRLGYGMTQAFTMGSDVTYSAATSVTKAAVAAAKEADYFTSVHSPVCLIVIPIIVIDAEMVESYLDGDGNLVVDQIDSCSLVWKHNLSGRPHTIIKVLTLGAVDEFAASMAASCSEFFDLAKEAIMDGKYKLPKTSKK